MEKIASKRNLSLHGFSYFVLLNYIESRLIINNFLCTDILDIYKDYLYFVSNLSEEQKKKNGLENIPKSLNQLVVQAEVPLPQPLKTRNSKNRIDNPQTSYAPLVNQNVGLIAKRNFGTILEKILQEKEPTIARKRSKSLVLQGVGLKSAEGVVSIDSILQFSERLAK